MPKRTTNWDVFVSHNRQEKPWVRQLVSQWRMLGLNVFFDEDSIDPGENIVKGIDRGLCRSRHVVLFISPASMRSRWVAMETANTIYTDPDSKLRRLIPVLVEVVQKSSISPTIRGLKWIDLTDSQSMRQNYHQLLKSLGVSSLPLPDPPPFEIKLKSDETAFTKPVIENQVALVNEELRTKQTSLIEIKIDRDFRDFSEADQASFIASVKELLKIGSIKVLNRRPGSVIITLALTRSQSMIVIDAIKRGHFNEHKVLEALILEKALVGTTENKSPDATQFVAMGDQNLHEKPRLRITPVAREEHAFNSSSDLIKHSTLYREFQAERDEILRHKWLESEKAGMDIGFERALIDWIIKHRSKWRKSRNLK